VRRIEPGNTRSTNAFIVEDHRFAHSRRAEFPERVPGGLVLVEVGPIPHRADELHEGQPTHELRTARREMERERRAPILGDQIRRADAELVDQRIEIVRMV